MKCCSLKKYIALVIILGVLGISTLGIFAWHDYVHSDPHVFGWTPGLHKSTYVMLTALPSDPAGHAYAVIIPDGDESKSIPLGEIPKPPKKSGIVETIKFYISLAMSVFESVPGGDEDQKYLIANPTYNPTLCVKIDNAKKAELLTLRDDWNDRKYKLLTSDCVTLVGLVANDVELNVPSRLLALDPKSFIIQLAIQNKDKFDFVQGPLTPEALRQSRTRSY